MKHIVIFSFFLLLSIFTACEAEDPIREESSPDTHEQESIIHAGEGTIVIIGEGATVIEESKKPRSVTMNQVFQDVVKKRPCHIGELVTIKATVADGSFPLRLGWIYLDTGHDDVEFVVGTESLFEVLTCEDYYKVGKTYEFTLFIDIIRFVFIEDSQVFVIEAQLILTKKLEGELRKAGCWNDKQQ